MIRQATYEDLKKIAAVHISCFPKSFSTALGKGNGGYLLEKFYKEYMDVVPELFLVAVDENHSDDIVGFAMGYYCEKNNYQNDFFKHNFLQIFMRIVLLLCCGNLSAWKKVTSVLKKSVAPEIKDEQYLSYPSSRKGDLLSICILPEYRGTGMSSALIEAFENVLRDQGREFIQLTVEMDNPRGISFYDKMGYMTYRVVANKKQGMYKRLHI